MFKKCTLAVWHEAHFEVKYRKDYPLGQLLEVEMLKKYTLVWREAHFEVTVTVSKLIVSDQLLTLRYQKVRATTSTTTTTRTTTTTATATTAATTVTITIRTAAAATTII